MISLFYSMPKRNECSKTPKDMSVNVYNSFIYNSWKPKIAQYPSIVGWANNGYFIHRMEYYTTMKNN